MIKRIFYALQMAWQHRQTLRIYGKDPSLQCTSVVELEAGVLRQQGFKAIIFDFDGVLASHGEEQLTPEVASWLNNFIQSWNDEDTLFVLSNKPEIERVKYFKKHFTGIKFIMPLRKKPYPDSVLQILQITGIQGRELLVVDDRLLTGVLAAVIANTKARYVTRPFISLEKRPVTESFFIVLRALEKLMFGSALYFIH